MVRTGSLIGVGRQERAAYCAMAKLSSFMQSFAKWFRFYFRIIDEAYKDSKRVVVFIISGLLGLQNITGDLAVVVLLVSVLKVS